MRRTYTLVPPLHDQDTPSLLMQIDYKSEHALRGTPPRKHYSRKGRARKIIRGHRV